MAAIKITHLVNHGDCWAPPRSDRPASTRGNDHHAPPRSSHPTTSRGNDRPTAPPRNSHPATSLPRDRPTAPRGDSQKPFSKQSSVSKWDSGAAHPDAPPPDCRCPELADLWELQQGMRRAASQQSTTKKR